MFIPVGEFKKSDWLKWAKKRKVAPAIIRHVKRRGFYPETPRFWSNIDTMCKGRKGKLTDADVKFLVKHELLHKALFKLYNKAFNDFMSREIDLNFLPKGFRIVAAKAPKEDDIYLI